MAKAIVRINAFLNKKQIEEVYNMIYNQLKAGFDVITVPSYCDVYVLDGADVEVQKKEKMHTPGKKSCSTCKYETVPILAEPCYSCIHGVCNENPHRISKWEEKPNCVTCNHFGKCEGCEKGEEE